jgi:hypothetical protein
MRKDGMSNREYLLKRAAQEDELASTATNRKAAVIHAAMAAEYRRRLFDLEFERRSGVPV